MKCPSCQQLPLVAPLPGAEGRWLAICLSTHARNGNPAPIIIVGEDEADVRMKWDTAAIARTLEGPL